MSALAFLSVDAAVDAKGSHPVAKSAIERVQRDAGAVFEERGGWLVPVSIPGEAERLAQVGIADLSHLTKLEVRPAGDAPEVGPDGVWYPISKRRALVFCPGDAAEAVRDQLADRFVLDLTGGLTIVAIFGPEADTVLRRLTHLHVFPAGGEVAHVQAHVLQRDGGYWIVCPQELGEYVWDVAVDRASALGGGPVGVDALGAGAGR